MKIRDILFGACLGFGAAAIANTPNPDWMGEALDIYLPQSQIVRHPIDTGKYYLCWTDGANRHGMAFRRTQMDQQLRLIPRGKRVSVATLMANTSTGTVVPWSASDDKVCWPR